jgi:gliding motility-associated-like protein
MKYLITFLISFLATELVYSQAPSKIWHFGVNAGIDFNYDPPKQITNGNHSFDEGGVTLTDENGDVLFYVDENTVYNRNNVPMKNGGGLIGNTGSSAQSPVALQDLKNPEMVYIFYVADHFDNSIIGQLRYSVIDLCGDNGKGEVLSNKKNIRVPGQYTERLTATYDAANKRYWILTSDYNTQNVKAFELTENGLSTTPVTSYLSDSSSPSYIGMISFNNQQNKIAYTCGLSGGYRGIILADFDINTGSLSNPMKIHDGDIYDVVFSPNSKYLYATDIFAGCVLYKFDLENRTKDKILYEKIGNYAFNAIEEGPDGKIYLAIASDNSIGQVAKPDLENEEFNPAFLKYSSPSQIGAGLQSTHHFKQIIRERKISNDLGPDTVVCSTINILLDSGLDQAKWSNGATAKTISTTASGQYYYYWRDCGVLYTDTINIVFEEEITETIASNYTFCEGDSIVLSVPSLEYIWNTGIKGDQLKVKDEGIYFSTYKEGCLTNINIFNVSVDTLLNLPDLKDTSYCNQSEYKLNLPKPYEIYDALNVKIPDDKLVNLNGSFLIRAQNTCGKFEQNITIKVDTFPNIPQDNYFMCSTLDFPLKLSTDVGETFWNKTFQSKNFIINEPGIYTYEVNNNCGEFKGTVSVALDEVTTLPNIFSPNGDSVNDEFPGINLKSFFNVIIFDRWGNLVWEGSKDWDGTHKSGSVVYGVYTYILKSLTCERQLVGTVTVIK